MNSLQELMTLIANEKYKVISFDIFDTLLLRPCVSPTDILKLAGRKVICSEFYLNLRRNCEQLARSNRNIMSDEIRFENIFREMADNYTFSEQEINDLKKYELECEFNLLRPRKSIKEIFDYAKGIGKKVIITSDIYLSKEFIGSVLDNCGYTGYEKLYLSSEYGMTKGSGRLYSQIIMDYKSSGVSAGEILHIGDNERSDIAAAEKAGLSVVHVRRVEAMAHKDYRFKRLEMFSERTCDNTFTMGHSINLILDDPYTADEKGTFLNSVKNVNLCVIAPMLFCYVKWLLSDCKRNGRRYLIFLNTEGYFIQRLAEIVKPYVFPELETVRVLLGNRLHRYLNNSVLSFMSKQNITAEDKIKTISRVLLLSDADEHVMTLFKKHGYNSGNDTIDDISVLYNMLDELDDLYEEKKAQEIGGFIKNISPYINEAAFFTDKSRDDLINMEGEEQSFDVYSVISDTDAPKHNCKFLAHMGMNMRRTIPTLLQLLERICNYQSDTGDSLYGGICDDIAAYTEEFCGLFKDYIKLMNLNAFQYFEFLKIAMLEYPDFPIKKLFGEVDKK